MAKVDINKYLRNGILNNDSLVQMHRDGISPMDRYSAIFAYGSPSSGRIDPGLERNMSDYFSKNPIGNQVLQNAAQYGMGERDFLNALDNRSKNYTYSIGPALQARVNSYRSGPTPTSVQAKDETPKPSSSPSTPTATPEVSPAQSMKIERVGQAGPVLSRKEAESIAKARGTNVESILSRSIKRGLTIGGNLATRFAKGKYDSAERKRELAMASMMPGFASAVGYGAGKPGTDSIRNFYNTNGPISGKSTLYVDKKGASSMLPRTLARTIPNPAPTVPTQAPQPPSSKKPQGGGSVTGSNPITTPTPSPLSINSYSTTATPTATTQSSQPAASPVTSNLGGGFGGASAAGIKRRGKGGTAMKRQSLGASAYNRANLGITGVNI